jgi:hypothetical protein
MKEILELVKADSRYQKNIEYEPADEAHPEGKIKFHIADLESNLKILSERGISEEDHWKLIFLIHVHDLFKAEAKRGLPPTHPHNHAYIAREFASEFTDDVDLLNMVQFHDENYKLWREYAKTGALDQKRFQKLLDTIQNWDLFLMFIIIDGCTAGKDSEKIRWFIDKVRKHKSTLVDSSWVIPSKRFPAKNV